MGRKRQLWIAWVPVTYGRAYIPYSCLQSLEGGRAMNVGEGEKNATPVGRFGRMKVIETDQMRGRRYRCACGWKGWSVWGHALRHAQTCPRSNEEVR